MVKNILFFITLSVVFCCCISTQQTSNRSLGSADYPPNAQPGKCYAKAQMPDQYAIKTSTVYEYTGDSNTEKVDFQTKAFTLRPALSKWEKKMMPNCTNPDPDACLVWCKVEQDAEILTLPILSDTTQTKNFKIRTIEEKTNLISAGKIEWQEVLCGNQTTPAIIQRIQASLMGKGYNPGILDGKISKLTQDALTKFQKDNNLPTGSLDFQTLDLLGIDY